MCYEDIVLSYLHVYNYICNNNNYNYYYNHLTFDQSFTTYFKLFTPMNQKTILREN